MKIKTDAITINDLNQYLQTQSDFGFELQMAMSS